MDLSGYRAQLDTVDEQIVRLMQERMRISEQIADVKSADGRRVLDKAREDEKMRTLCALTDNDFDRKCVQELYDQIMSMSRKLQYQRLAATRNPSSPVFVAVDTLEKKDCRVVFQGAEGAYSHAALKQFFGDAVQDIPVETFRDAFGALEEGICDYAVLPIENSTAGVVAEVYDLLSEYENYIVGEQLVKIEHCLIGTPDATMEDIREVYSHPQSLSQCARFLREHPGWEQISMKNNAFAVQKIAQDRTPAHAAIASAYAASCYGMKVLKERVNQSATNSTRFIIVSGKKIYLKSATHISICFEAPHEAGSLYRLLSHFIYNDLNMTRIESRPIEDKNWEYRFFVDFEGNLADAAVLNALCGLREEARSLRVLGNF